MSRWSIRNLLSHLKLVNPNYWIGWGGIVLLAFVRFFVPQLAFLATGYRGLIIVLLLISLSFYDPERYSNQRDSQALLSE
jgi:hypothetical protein